MKNIKDYNAKKYKDYTQVENGIYLNEIEKIYVTSLSFEQEPEYGEGEFADDISQNPLEDILDEFGCYISDYYDDLNIYESKECYYEFASFQKEDIEKLRSIIGKHVYNVEYEKDGKIYIKLVIEQILYTARLACYMFS